MTGIGKIAVTSRACSRLMTASQHRSCIGTLVRSTSTSGAGPYPMYIASRGIALLVHWAFMPTAKLGCLAGLEGRAGEWDRHVFVRQMVVDILVQALGRSGSCREQEKRHQRGSHWHGNRPFVSSVDIGVRAAATGSLSSRIPRRCRRVRRGATKPASVT